MPCYRGKQKCEDCGKDVWRRTARRHSRWGCPGSKRRTSKLLKSVTADIAKKGRSRSPSPVWTRQKRRPPTSAPPPPIPPRKRRRRRRRSPSVDLSDNDGFRTPDTVDINDADLDPARSRHSDFCFDSPGAGPSSGLSPPPPKPRSMYLDDETPLTLKDVAPWIEGLKSEQVISQELPAEVTRRGGCKLNSDELFLVEGFNYKVDTDITGRAYDKLHRAFRSRLSDLPSDEQTQARAAKLAGIRGVEIDCCPSSCVAFTGPYERRITCPLCGTPRFTIIEGRQCARQTFLYIPIIPRLVNMFRDLQTAQKLGYRNRRQRRPGILSDIFDGEYYQQLRKQRVTIGGTPLEHTYFSSPTDVALGLSTDGFGPFKTRGQQCWPIIVFNYNLPPSIRTHLEHILCLGVIPGPSSPKELDSFLEPFIDELEDLARGIPAFNAEHDHTFCLRAYLIACFGDMPAVSKLMCMKGHNGKFPCRACRMVGIREPGSTTYYTPLLRPWAKPSDGPRRYDPLNLPRRTHKSFLQQAVYVEAAKTDADESYRSLHTGINGVSTLARLSSLDFPRSFPHDFMHVVFQNIIPTLLNLWTRNDKYTNFGDETDKYLLDKTVWAAIGTACAASGDTIPASFGCRVPNLQSRRSESTAESMMIFATMVGPALLRNRFKDTAYFNHFIALVRLINKCLSRTLTVDDIQFIRVGFAKWVCNYERLYYRKEPKRLCACTLPLHALLHIADDIEALGPVWAYWAFPMERFNGALARANKSRRFPYSSLERYVLQVAQLAQIKLIYGLMDWLNLDERHDNIVTGDRYDNYPELVFARPSREKPLDSQILRKVAKCIGDSLGLDFGAVLKVLGSRSFTHWGKMQQTVRSRGMDLIRGHLTYRGEPRMSRDASYVKYKSCLSRWDWKSSAAREVLVGHAISFGRVEEFVVIDADFLQELALSLNKTNVSLSPIVLAHISPIPHLKRLADVDLIQYKLRPGGIFGGPEIVDVLNIEGLVGRVTTDVGRSYIVDRQSIVGRLDMLDLMTDTE